MPVTTAQWRAILLGYCTVPCVYSTNSRRSSTLSVELGTLRKTQHTSTGHATLYWTSQRHVFPIDQCEDGGAHGISSMAYQIGQPDRLSTNIFAVTSVPVGLGGHRVECVACSERRKR